jgi:hypothetical protein
LGVGHHGRIVAGISLHTTNASSTDVSLRTAHIDAVSAIATSTGHPTFDPEVGMRAPAAGS